MSTTRASSAPFRYAALGPVASFVPPRVVDNDELNREFALRRMERAHVDVVDSLGGLPPSSLRDPAHEYTVVDWLPVPGWRHERRHLDEVREWWRQARKAASKRR